MAPTICLACVHLLRHRIAEWQGEANHSKRARCCVATSSLIFAVAALQLWRTDSSSVRAVPHAHGADLVELVACFAAVYSVCAPSRPLQQASSALVSQLSACQELFAVSSHVVCPRWTGSATQLLLLLLLLLLLSLLPHLPTVAPRVTRPG